MECENKIIQRKHEERVDIKIYISTTLSSEANIVHRKPYFYKGKSIYTKLTYQLISPWKSVPFMALPLLKMK